MEIILDGALFTRVLGDEDANIRLIEDRFRSKLVARDGRIMVTGPSEEQSSIRRVFADLQALCQTQGVVSLEDVDTILRLAGAPGNGESRRPTGTVELVLEVPRGQIQPKSPHQLRYLQMMARETVVFAVGPAGTGKTYLAVAMAVDRFLHRAVDKIILTRPVVEAGENLGFLPGDVLEKVNPYFRPLYDALDEMLTRERVRRLIDRGLIEVAPLAYMRGRTLNNAFVILDEAQNTTSGQMKMFLTRLGAASRAVLTGDVTQIDLPDPNASGLLEARRILTGIEGIGFIEFDESDVVRHRLVADILKAYEQSHRTSG